MSTSDVPPQAEPLPFHLRGNYAPVTNEVTAFDLPVQGAIPRELTGRYVRNGPNPKTGQSPHWFQGDGMLHGLALADGRAKVVPESLGEDAGVRGRRPVARRGRHARSDRRQGQHAHHRACWSSPGARRDIVSHGGHDGSGDRRVCRLRWAAHHGHDRASEDLPTNPRAPFLCLLAPSRPRTTPPAHRSSSTTCEPGPRSLTTSAPGAFPRSRCSSRPHRRPAKTRVG